MATIPDERLEPVAAVEKAKKITPAALRVIDVPGTGAQLLGNLRQVDALLVVLDAWSGGRNPDDDLVTLQLELLIADRDHVERRLERVRKQAKSGDPQQRDEVVQLEAVLAHLEAERLLSEWPGELPPGLEPLTTKPIIEVRNGPGGLDAKLEAELAELPEEEAAAFREGAAGAVGEIARRLFEAVDLISFFDDPHRYRARVHPLRGDPLERPRRGGFASGGGAAGSAAPRGEELRGRGRRRAEHPLQRLAVSFVGTGTRWVPVPEDVSSNNHRCSRSHSHSHTRIGPLAPPSIDRCR